MMEEGELLGSGKLKIFFSYAPGTGKTRTMLTAKYLVQLCARSR